MPYNKRQKKLVANVALFQDVAHAILEAYSRVLGNLAFSILTRIGDVSHEDMLSNPDSSNGTNRGETISIPSSNTKASSHTLIDKMDNIEGKMNFLKTEEDSHVIFLSG